MSDLLPQIEKELKKSGRFSAEDMSALTGFELNETKRTIELLMKKYVCSLQVNEHGDLIYNFGKHPVARGSKSFTEYWSDFVNLLWRAFQVVFKVWITLMLVVYFVVFVVILIAGVVGLTAASKGDSNSKGSGIGSILSIIVRLFAELFIWNQLGKGTYNRTDKFGYKYKNYTPKPSVISGLGKKAKKSSESKKQFIASVFDFVFGPKRVPFDPLGNRKEVATFIRKNKGIVTVAELKALAGWNEEQAGQFMTECLVDFDGDGYITDNGVLYGDFKDFSRSNTKQEGADIIWYWNEYEPDFVLSGNTTARNVGVVAMNLFNLVMSVFILNSGAGAWQSMAAIDTGGVPEFTVNQSGSWLAMGLGWVPLVFSLLFFLIPVLRWVSYIPKRKKRHIANIKKRLVKLIYLRKGKKVGLTELKDTVNKNTNGEENLDTEIIEQTMTDLLHDWNGEMIVTDDAQIIYEFDHLRNEIKDAQQLRRNRKEPKQNSEIVYDTKNEEL